MLTIILIAVIVAAVATIFFVMRGEQAFRDEVTRSRKETADALAQLRQELGGNIQGFTSSINQSVMGLTQLNREQMDAVRQVVDERLRSIQEDSSKKLEDMRRTVDEKLSDTLNKRLGESFQQVSARLEAVHKGLGEMQTIAAGVGDLKKVLTNVKTRGNFGEIQLEALLEQILTREQFASKVAIKKNREQVDFAIRLPGKGDDAVVYLPIDAKFPTESYQRMVEAGDKGDVEILKEAGKALENDVKIQAKSIADKYIDPPETTDFAIMFLPSEGLYAEVLRRPGLVETLQRERKVVVAGPTTIAALINSLQMGFRTLAIEKRAGEVGQLLSAVKKEFGSFSVILERTKKQIDTVSGSLDQAMIKTRTIDRKLKNVENLPVGVDAQALLDLPPETAEEV